VATVMPGEIEFRIDAPSTTALLGGLLNGKSYEVYLFAENGDGRSETAGPFLATPTNGLDGVVGRLVVQYEDGVASTEAPGVATGSSSVSGIELVPEVDLGDGLHTVSLSEPVTAEDAAQIVTELESDTRVKWAEVDQVVTTASAEPTAENLDPDYLDRQWNMWSDFGVGGSKLFPSTFGRGLADLGKGVTVAVIDTGITKHSDFGPRVLPGYDFVSNRAELSAVRQEGKDAVAFDGDYVDEDEYGPAGWDDNALDPGDWREVAPVRNSSWHGTHVAGIIGAEVSNARGIAGLVPLVDILPVRALSWRGGLSSDIAASIIWASGGRVEGVEDNANPAQVINLSFTTKSACSETFQKAIDTAVENGSVIAVAAGNANSDVRDYAPANCNNVVAVGATDATGKRAAYSNFGEGIDISAPGGDVNASGDLGVYSLSNSGEREPGDDSYAYRQGTSMSAAHVTAALARLSALHPNAKPLELISMLTNKASVRPFADDSCDAEQEKQCGSGIVEIAANPLSPGSLTAAAGVRSVSLKWPLPVDASITGVSIKWGTDASALTNQFTVAGRTVNSFVHSGSPVRVTNKALTSNIATLTTGTAHGLVVGDSVAVSGVDATFNGTHVIRTVTSTTFTYSRTAANVTSVALATAGNAQRAESLTIGQTYYYQIGYVYTDNAQSCTTACISDYASVVSAQTQFLASTNFANTGAIQTYTVPTGVSSILVDAVGAAGGSTATITGGLGGRVQASIPTTQGEMLFVFVGGTSGASAVGWNGGGAGTAPGMGGGGATDIRRGFSVTKASMSGTTATLTTTTAHGFAVGNAILVANIGTTYDGTYTVLAVPTTTTLTYTKTGGSTTSETTGLSGAVIQTLPSLGLTRRILVAGGGGGAGSHAKAGSGGELIGETATGWGVVGAAGGTQSTGNALAVGGNGTTNAGGGGGGYWGGRGGAAYGGGGGGSSYVDAGAFGVVHTQAYSLATGNGSLRISIPNVATMPTPTTFAGTAWSRAVELTWDAPTVDGVTGYRIKWGTDNTTVNQFDVAGGDVRSFTHSSRPFAVTAKAKTTTVATLTTAVDHGLLVGQQVSVTGVDSVFDGVYAVATVPTTKTFTFAKTGAAVASVSVSPTGLVQRTGNLTVGQDYYYKIAAIYTDITQSCGTSCLSAYTSTITVDGKVGNSQTFEFNDGTHTYKVPPDVTKIQVDAQGGAGGYANNVAGGFGGRLQATVPVTPGETLFIYVGGGGGDHYPFEYKAPSSGGRNGGGAGSGNGSGGGGATDIRRGFTVTNAALTSNVVTLTTSVAHGFVVGNSVVITGVGAAYDGTYAVVSVPTTTTFTYAKTAANITTAVVNGAVFYSSTSLGLARRILVAGGGGGVGHNAYTGGAGGGLVGRDGVSYSCETYCGGMGGSQSVGNALGIGGTGGTNGGGGGGGYRGGYGAGQGGQPDGRGTAGHSGGGGGSSWTASDIVFATHTQGFRNGNGLLTITTAQTAAVSTPVDLAAYGWNTRVHVSWTASTNQETTGYRIKWGTASGALTNVINVAGRDVTEYVHTSRAMGTRYFYSIAAVFTDMNQDCLTACLSDFSAEESDTPRFTAATSFDFTETIQSYTVPAGVTRMNVSAQGAQGGNSRVAGGLGGIVTATMPVTPGETLFVFVGGGGGDNHPARYQVPSVGGWNGGGNGNAAGGSGGGGATDIRRGVTVTNASLTSRVATLTTSVAHGFVAGNSVVVAGVGALYDGTFVVVAAPTTTTFTYAKVELDQASATVNGAVIRNSTTLNLDKRVIVGGGGGGVGNNANVGGVGGGLTGGEGANHGCPSNCAGLGGSQTYGNALGVGASATVTGAGAGGGGYWGGYASGQSPQQWRTETGGYSGGGGGSSWTASNLSFVTHSQGAKSGNGKLEIYAQQGGSISAPTNFDAYGYQAQVVLSWTPSPQPIVSGYRISWGTSQGVLTNNIDVPDRLAQSFVHHGNTFSVTAKSLATNVATLTTSSAHGIAVGNEFIVQGAGDPFDGTYTATTGTTGTTIKYARTNANVASASISPAAVVSRTKQLAINTTYYYEISALYTDAAQTCNTTCESGSSTQRYATPIFTQDTTFASTDGVQTFTVPAGVSWLQFDAQGAGGGRGSTGIGGFGGRVQGAIPVTSGEVLYLYVGGKGGGSLNATQHVGGWNGGGNGSGAGVGGGGGGATDIRRNRLVVTNKVILSSVATLTTAETHGLSVGSSVIVSGVGTEFNGTFTLTAINATNKTLSYAVSTSSFTAASSSGTISGPSAWNTAASLATRVVVAGGAGGGGNDKVGGIGGGLVAGQGASNSCATGAAGDYCSGLGGSQTYGNALGTGGATGQTNAGGGGGGYWGGWGSGQSPQLSRVATGGYSGGGGGSSFTSAAALSSLDQRTISGITHTSGFNQSDGVLTLSVPTRAYPTGVEALGWGGYNSISWDASNITGVTQYKVYGGTTQNPTTLLATLPVGINAFDHHLATPIVVSQKALTSNVVTLTTASAHGLSVGTVVSVSGVDPAFNGLRTITAVASTTLSFAFTAANIASTAIQSGVVQSANSLTYGTAYYYRVSIMTGSIESERSTEVSATPALSSSTSFESTGAVQTFTVPVNVNKIFIDALGAGGARGTTGVGGAGGRAQGAIPVTPGEVLYLYVGGKGGGSLTSTLNVGGFNGGGNGSAAGQGGGGGGATDIRRNRLVVTNKVIASNVATLTTAETHGLSVGSSVIVSDVGTEFNGTFTLTAIDVANKKLSYAVSTSSFTAASSSGTVSGPSTWNTAASLATRVVVAGGGAGGGNDRVGGVGGGLVAGQGGSNSCGTGAAGDYCSGQGGSQTYGNALGVGGAGAAVFSGGGGGGYWGGWGAAQSPQLDRRATGGYSGGGGGSSFTSADVTSVFHAQGMNSDAGSAVISWTSTPIVTGVQATPLNASVAVSWNASNLGSLSGYRVYGGTTAAPTTLLATVGAGVIGYTHTGLTNGTMYFYRISAIVTENGVTTATPLSGEASATPTTLTTTSFAATGAVQTFVVPERVLWLQLDASGAQGGTGSTGVGGLGGRTQGALEVVPGETLYFYVGGAGGKPTAGWNGGGTAQDSHGGGGGATDVRRNKLVVTNKVIATNVATLTTAATHGLSVGDSIIVLGVGADFDGTFVVTAINATNKTLSYAKTASNVASSSATGTVSGPSLWSTAASLATRALVAGGGGGGGNTNFGGVGGGLIGGEGRNHSCPPTYCAGFGGSQTYGNALGVGGNAAGNYSGGGGGGYWGGWGSGQVQLDRSGTGGYSGGGGGSSYTASDVAVPVHTQGFKSGAGSLTVSYSVDNTSPVVTGISSPNPSGNYIVGREITVNVAFSKAVVVTGTPTLLLDAGTRDVQVNYVSGSGTSTLTFTYVVATGDLKDALNIKSTTALALPTSPIDTIKDRAGNNAVLTLPEVASAASLSGSKLLSIDGVVPAKPTVLSAAGVDGITLDWADNTEDDLKEYRIYSCSGLVASSCSSLSSFSVLSSVVSSVSTFEHIAVGRGISYYYYVTAVDLRGNESPASDRISWMLPVPVLVATPTVVVATPTNDLTPQVTGAADAGATVYVYLDGSSTPLGSTVATSEGAYAFSPPSNISAGTHTFRARAVVTGVKTGTSGFSNSASVDIDTTAPSLSSISRFAPSSETTGLDALTFRLIFTEAVSGLLADDFAISGSTATVSRIAMLSGSTGTYDVTVSGGNLSDRNGVVGLLLAAGATVADVAGNALTSVNAATTPQTYTLDNRNPVATITASATTLGGANTATITFTLDQSSTDFGADDIASAGGTLSGFTGSGTTYTATFTPSTGFSGTATISVDAGSFKNASEVFNTASSLNITVDTTAPRVLSVQSPTTNGLYKVGAVIDVTVTFNENIAVTTGGGVPTLLLEMGATDQAARYLSTSGAVATFRYTTVAGDVTTDLDFVTTSSLALNGGSIRDVAGNAANITLMSPGATGSLAANAAIGVDTVAPQAPTSLVLTPIGGVVRTNKLTATNTNLTASATVVAGEATSGTATLYLDGVSLATDSTIGSGDVSVTFDLGKTTTAELQAAVAAGGVLTVKTADLAGNLSLASTGVTLGIDYAAPTIALTSSRSALLTGQTATITATLSEATSDFAVGDITVAGGAVSSFAGSGTSYTFTFTPTANSTTSMSISVQAGSFADAFGNTNSASNTLGATVDTAAPSVTSVSSSSADGPYRAGATLSITVAFNDIVTVSTGSGVPTLLLETGTTDTSATYSSGSGTNTLTFRYVVQAGNTSSDLDQQSNAALALNGGTIRDASGNDAVLTLASPAASGSLGANKAIVIDTVAPSAPTSLAATAIGGTVVANTLLASNTNMTATASITAGQATGGSAELLLGSAVIATDASISSGDTSVSFTLGLTTTAQVQAAIAAGGVLTTRLIDLAGNTSASSTAVNLAVDYVVPTVALTISRSSFKIGQTATVSVELSESSSNFVVGDISVVGGLLSGFTGSGTTYSATFTPTNGSNALSGSLSIALGAFTDAAGNASSASSTLTLTIDTFAPDAPAVTGTSPIATRIATPTISGTAEANAVVSLADNSTTPATQLGTATADANNAWSLTVPTLLDGDHAITATATDAAGNTSVASTSKTWRVDTTPPSVSMTAVAGNDNVTRAEKDAGVTVTGTVEAGATVSLAFAGVTPTPSATVSGTSWSYVITSSDWTAIGSTTPVMFTATATDAVGNTASRARTVVMNLVAIAVPGTPVLLAADDSGTQGDNRTLNRTVRLDVALEKTTAPIHAAGQVLKLVDASGSVIATRTLDAADVAAGTYRFTVGPLDDGIYTYSTTISGDGNTASSASSLALTIDNRVPGTPGAPDMESAGDTGTSGSDNVTSNTRPEFRVAVDGVLISGSPLIAGDRIVLFGGSEELHVITLASGDISSGYAIVRPSVALASGTYVFTAGARSVAGTSGAASTSITAVIDTAGQSAPGAPDLIAEDDAGTSSTDNNTSVVQPRFTVALAGTSAVANDILELLDSAGTVIGQVMLDSTAISAGVATVAPTGTFADGSIVVKARIKDRAGNLGTSSSTLTIVVNTALPAAPILALASSSDTGTSATDRITARNTPTFSGTGTNGDTIKIYSGSTELGSTVVAGGVWSITFASTLSDATHTLRAQTIDAAGNASSYSANLAVVVDTTRPSAPQISGSPLSKNSPSPTISGTAEALAIVKLYASSSLVATTTADQHGAWSVALSSLTDAAYSITASATDTAGNTSSDSTVASLSVDTAAPAAPTMNALSTFSLTPTLSGTGEVGATVEVFDGAVSLGTAVVGSGGLWSFAVSTLGAGAHSFTAKQTDPATNVSVSSNPARTMSAVQTGALIGADGTDDNDVSLTVSQYSADGISSIDTAAKASLLNDVIDKLSSSAVDTQAELAALAATVAGIFETAAGGNASPALTPEALTAIGISGVNADNLAAVIAALAATADSGSGVDSLSELLSVVDASVAASNAALATISSYTGSNTAPTATTYEDAGVSGVSASNIGAVNSAIAHLGQAATDTASEVQAVVDAYAALLNAADGVANGGATLSVAQFQTLGLTVIDTTAEALLLNAIADVGSSSSIDTFAELTNLASIVNRLSIIAAGGTASPALTAQDFEALGITGVTAENLSAVIAAIAATADDGSGINTMAKLQNAANEGVVNARAASQGVIAAYTGTNTAPTLADYQNAVISGVTSSNIAAINSVVAQLSATATDSQAEIQAVVDAYALVTAAANGLADGGAMLSTTDYAALGLGTIDTSAEVSLMNNVLDGKTASGVDTYAELAAIAAAVSGVIAEATGVGASPSLTVADFALLGISGVTESNLAQVIAALRSGASDGSDVDTISELRAVTAAAVAAAKSAAINVISQYDGTSGSTVPSLADYANAEVTGVTSANIGSINSAFALIEAIASDVTAEIQAAVTAYVAVLAGADGTDNNNTSITESSFAALGLSTIDTSGKAALLSEVLDVKARSDADEYSEIKPLETIISAIFVVSTGEASDTELTVAMFTSIGVTGVNSQNLQLVINAIAATNDDTTGVDSLAEIQAVVTQVRSDQASALAVISNYTGSNTTPTLATFNAAGVVGVDAQNIGIINQYLAAMSIVQTDTVAEVQALIDAVIKLLLCADGIANNNCALTAEEFQALGYTEIDTAEEVAALNEAMDVLDLTPDVPSSSGEHASAAPVVAEVIQRFTRQVSNPSDAGGPGVVTVPTTVPVTVPITVPVTVTVPTTITSPPITVKPRPVNPVTAAPTGDAAVVTPGEATAVIDGDATVASVVVDASNKAVITVGDGVVIYITPEIDVTGLIGDSSVLHVVQGSRVEVSGSGFAPNSQVDVWLNSDPVYLGAAQTDDTGSFTQEFVLPPDAAVGNHTLTMIGLNKLGQELSAAVGVVVLDKKIVDASVEQTPATDDVPFDPQSEPKGVVDLIANLVALLALASLGGGASGSAGRREDEETDDERGSGDVSDVAVKHYKTDTDGKDALRMPRISFVDRVMMRAPSALAHRSPLLGRVLVDGTYLRSGFGALWLALPILGVCLGFLSALNTGFDVRMPSLMLLTAVVVLGTLDAFSGYLASVVFGTAVLLGGGMNSADSIRGVVGIWVFSFGVPLLATATRPFRRTATGVVGVWERCADVVLIALFGAWAAGAMFSSLPGLIGFKPEYADRVSHIQLVVLVALVSRFILENVVAVFAPSRLREFSPTSLRDASTTQIVISSLLRTAAYVFVASVFIGNNWALWVGGAVYLIPKLVALVDDALPNFSIVHRYVPRGILKVVLMLFVARWWGDILGSRITDPEQMIKVGFVLLGLPGIVLTVLGWFARSSRPWPSTWFTRLSGMLVLIIGILVVFGVLP
jgi:hypothetical protein